jgi:hypothetical protein
MNSVTSIGKPKEKDGIVNFSPPTDMIHAKAIKQNIERVLTLGTERNELPRQILSFHVNYFLSDSRSALISSVFSISHPTEKLDSFLARTSV